MTHPPPKKRIGELLQDRGIITEDHIGYALQVQKITGDKLGETLEKLDSLSGCGYRAGGRRDP
jgi:hypothetical protein